MIVNINLNIHYTAPKWVWDKIDEVYRSMPYFDESAPYPTWKSEGILIEASAEPSGLQFYGDLPEDVWEEWYGELREKLEESLDTEIGEPEDGVPFKYDWDEDE